MTHEFPPPVPIVVAERGVFQHVGCDSSLMLICKVEETFVCPIAVHVGAAFLEYFPESPEV